MRILMRIRRDASIDSTLRSIENKVMGDLWLGDTRRRAGRVLAACLAATAVAGWLVADGRTHKVALVASVLFILGSVISLVALYLQRFAWGCAAVYMCGVATVSGVGAFWWYRTAQVDSMPLVTVLGSTLSATLTVGWLAVLMAPIQRYQPDMRSD